jgi:hypothetical protein
MSVVVIGAGQAGLAVSHGPPGGPGGAPPINDLGNAPTPNFVTPSVGKRPAGCSNTPNKTLPREQP